MQGPAVQGGKWLLHIGKGKAKQKTYKKEGKVMPIKVEQTAKTEIVQGNGRNSGGFWCIPSELTA